MSNAPRDNIPPIYLEVDVIDRVRDQRNRGYDCAMDITDLISVPGGAVDPDGGEFYVPIPKKSNYEAARDAVRFAAIVELQTEYGWPAGVIKFENVLVDGYYNEGKDGGLSPDAGGGSNAEPFWNIPMAQPVGKFFDIPKHQGNIKMIPGSTAIFSDMGTVDPAIRNNIWNVRLYFGPQHTPGLAKVRYTLNIINVAGSVIFTGTIGNWDAGAKCLSQPFNVTAGTIPALYSGDAYTATVGIQRIDNGDINPDKSGKLIGAYLDGYK
jgi:hypothetical protein